MTVHVLVSARDPGGAAQVREVAPALRADARARVTVIASGVAAEILAAAGESPIPFALPDGSTHLARGADPSALLAATRELIERVSPDVLLVGISSLGVGLDEALLACAAGRPTFALQDYPGDANAIGQVYAGLYFVRDAAAAALTETRFGVRAIPIGSLRHASYEHLDVAGLRSRARGEIGARAGESVIGFFGQPAEIPGHEAAFGHLIAALAERRDRPLVVLREHPKAREAFRSAHLWALTEAGARVFDASDAGPVEPWLVACDLVTTCFSHCTMDYAFLSAHSDVPLGAVLFVLPPEAREFLRDYGGLVAPDGFELGLGRIAPAPAEVRPLMQLLLSEGGRREYHDAARRLPRRAAVDLIVATVIQAGLSHVAGDAGRRPAQLPG
jgi:hypothetical protein